MADSPSVPTESLPVKPSDVMNDQLRTVATAKKQSERSRTEDIAADSAIDFASLQLSHEILLGISELGWTHPSPVQQKAIPLGKFGADLIVQAKSGTGKTCVFSVIALEKINLGRGSPQVIILAPTREIAVQITEVINGIGKHLSGLSCQTFIGGLAIKSDLAALRRCHIIVGTPGRVAQLIEERAFDLAGIRLFVLDEADKLLDENFLPQVQWIASKLPKHQTHRPLQTLAFSATFTPKLIETVKTMMKSPQEILLAPDAPSLKGVKQYYYLVPADAMESSWKQWTAKVTKLLEIFSKISFHQCVVFTNDRARAEVLKGKLNDEGWPSNFIAGGQAQQQRLGTMVALKDFQIRVLISTDLTARGIDIERVNLVINLDMPAEPETYLHRVGRTGRFGTYGVAISFVNTAELGVVEKICNAYQTTIAPLPEEIPREYYAYTLDTDHEKKSLETLHMKRQQALANPTNTELIDPATQPKPKVKNTANKETKAAGEQEEEEYNEEEAEYDEDAEYDDEEEHGEDEEYEGDEEEQGEEGDEEEEEGEEKGDEAEDAESLEARRKAWAQYFQQYYSQYNQQQPNYQQTAQYPWYPCWPSYHSAPPPLPPPPPPPHLDNLQHTYQLYQTYYSLLCIYYQLLGAYHPQ